jgi:hypothetical protein
LPRTRREAAPAGCASSSRSQSRLGPNHVGPVPQRKPGAS